ncbi:MAG: hypothetical protein N2C12_02115 [Planctomycetales bacterium]
MRFAILLAVGLIPLSSGTAMAQWYGGSANVGYHASTVAEGRGNAISSVTRAKGQYQIDKSQSRINDAQAESMEMQNRVTATNDYFERREINRKNRFGDYAQKKEKNTQERMFKYGKEGRPTRLTSKELDPITGQITWPIALEAPNFKDYRNTIDGEFVKRAESHSRFSYDGYQAVTKSIDGMQTKLRSEVSKIQPMNWTSANDFVKRLTAEARYASS